MKKFLSIIIGLLIGVGITIGMLKIDKASKYDSEFKKIILNNNEFQHKKITIDIGKEGPIKYYLDPNEMTIYLRLYNDLDRENITFDTADLQVIASQNSKRSAWKKVEAGSLLYDRGPHIIPLNLEIKLPKDAIYHFYVHRGYVNIYSNKEKIAEIELEFINSRYPKIN